MLCRLAVPSSVESAQLGADTRGVRKHPGVSAAPRHFKRRRPPSASSPPAEGSQSIYKQRRRPSWSARRSPALSWACCSSRPPQQRRRRRSKRVGSAAGRGSGCCCSRAPASGGSVRRLSGPCGGVAIDDAHFCHLRCFHRRRWVTIWEDRFSDRQAPTGGNSKWIAQLGVRGLMPLGGGHRWKSCTGAWPATDCSRLACHACALLPVRAAAAVCACAQLECRCRRVSCTHPVCSLPVPCSCPPFSTRAERW